MAGGRGPQGTVPLRMQSLWEKSPWGGRLPWRRYRWGRILQNHPDGSGCWNLILSAVTWNKHALSWSLESSSPSRWTGVTLRTGVWTMLLDISPQAPSKCSTLNESTFNVLVGRSSPYGGPGGFFSIVWSLMLNEAPTSWELRPLSYSSIMPPTSAYQYFL